MAERPAASAAPSPSATVGTRPPSVTASPCNLTAVANRTVLCVAGESEAKKPQAPGSCMPGPCRSGPAVTGAPGVTCATADSALHPPAGSAPLLAGGDDGPLPEELPCLANRLGQAAAPAVGPAPSSPAAQQGAPTPAVTPSIRPPKRSLAEQSYPADTGDPSASSGAREQAAPGPASSRRVVYGLIPGLLDGDDNARTPAASSSPNSHVAPPPNGAKAVPHLLRRGAYGLDPGWRDDSDDTDDGARPPDCPGQPETSNAVPPADPLPSQPFTPSRRSSTIPPPPPPRLLRAPLGNSQDLGLAEAAVA